MTTIGFGDVRPDTDGGKIVTIVAAFLMVAAFSKGLLMISGEMTQFVEWFLVRTLVRDPTGSILRSWDTSKTGALSPEDFRAGVKGLIEKRLLGATTDAEAWEAWDATRRRNLKSDVKGLSRKEFESFLERIHASPVELTKNQHAPCVLLVELIVGLIVGVCCNYHLQEKKSWVDSIYKIIQLVTTIGFGDVPIESRAHRIMLLLYCVWVLGIEASLMSLWAEGVQKHELQLSKWILRMCQRMYMARRRRRHQHHAGLGRDDTQMEVAEREDEKMANFSQT